MPGATPGRSRPGEAPVPRLPTTRPHHLPWWADTPSCTTVEPEHEVNRAATGRARLRLDRLRAAGPARRARRRPRSSPRRASARSRRRGRARPRALPRRRSRPARPARRAPRARRQAARTVASTTSLTSRAPSGPRSMRVDHQLAHGEAHAAGRNARAQRATPAPRQLSSNGSCRHRPRAALTPRPPRAARRRPRPPAPSRRRGACPPRSAARPASRPRAGSRA